MCNIVDRMQATETSLRECATVAGGIFSLRMIQAGWDMKFDIRL